MVKWVSSRKPWRLTSSRMSSIQVAGPPRNGVSISGRRMCQISAQHSRAGWPSARGMLGAAGSAGRRRCRSGCTPAPTRAAGESVGQHEADHRAQGRGPGLDRAQRRLRPIDRADELAHLAAADEPVRCCFSRRDSLDHLDLHGQPVRDAILAIRPRRHNRTQAPEGKDFPPRARDDVIRAPAAAEQTALASSERAIVSGAGWSARAVGSAKAKDWRVIMEARAGSVAPRRGPLTGIRVIELADEQAEYCGLLLAGLGADVIKVEPPGGSPTRRIGPFYEDAPTPSARCSSGSTTAASARSRSTWSRPETGSASARWWPPPTCCWSRRRAVSSTARAGRRHADAAVSRR